MYGLADRSYYNLYYGLSSIFINKKIYIHIDNIDHIDYYDREGLVGFIAGLPYYLSQYHRFLPRRQNLLLLFRVS